MSLTEIKSAVRELPPKELAELARFILEQDNAAWTRQMQEDAARGKLDFLFAEAEKERPAAVADNTQQTTTCHAVLSRGSFSEGGSLVRRRIN